MTRHTRVLFMLAALASVGVSAAAQPMRFEDVVRNLRNPDPKVRLSAVRLLREARYPEAVAPLAPLVTDPVDEIQIEAIAAELSFFVADDLPARRRVGFVLEVRSKAQAMEVFERGPAVVSARAVPPELVTSLLHAIDDEHKRVRIEAIYTLGAIAKPPLAEADAVQLVKAIDHYDPAIRAAAARVAGRLQVKSAGDALITAVNDSHADVRLAAMRALGEIGEPQAVQALTDQLNYYEKGDGARAAIEALARIAHSSSVPVFRTRLADKDPAIRRAAAEGLGRTGDAALVDVLQENANTEQEAPTRAAMAFAMQKLGHNYLQRLVDYLEDDRMAPQILDYLFELGPSMVPHLLPRLQETDAATRAHLAEALGLLGNETAIPALEPLTKDRDAGVVKAATQAIDRIRTDQR